MKPIGLKIGVRTPFVKMGKELARINAVDLSAHVIDGLLEQEPQLKDRVQHVVWGMVIQDPNIYSIAREATLASGLPSQVEGYSLSRACATSLQAAANACAYYQAFPEEASASVVGGVESFSTSRPVVTDKAANFFRFLATKAPASKKLQAFFKTPFKAFIPGPPSAKEYSTGLTMGQHCELMVKDFKIGRERQDRFALQSHQNAAAAREHIQAQLLQTAECSKDTLIREDTTLEALGTLKTAFDRSEAGTLTAGNSSPLTDGAACLTVVSPALESELVPDGYMVDFEFVGVEPNDGLLMGPGKALLRLMQRNQLQWDQVDYIEIHEAFAGQVLCNVDAVNNPTYRKETYGVDYDAGTLDETKINPWGSSVAYGHPFGATGARMLSQALQFLKTTGKQQAILGVCTAGALAGAALLRREV